MSFGAGKGFCRQWKTQIFLARMTQSIGSWQCFLCLVLELLSDFVYMMMYQNLSLKFVITSTDNSSLFL
ncbi:hypothetical protein NC651_000469 [Populus alba x Populus x berolinensis]|nr:hypothetical protein NC651_000469 [Populus alba x Populus x berolinensis]